MTFHFKKIILAVMYRTDCRGAEAKSTETIQKTSVIVQVTDYGGLDQDDSNGEGEKTDSTYKVELTYTYKEDLG